MNSPLLKTLIADISAHTTACVTTAPTRKKGCDIDAQVLALVLQKPGSRRIDLLDMRPDGLTEIAVAESLHRLKTSGKVIAVRPVYHNPERYWPTAMSQAAAVFQAVGVAQAVDTRVLTALRNTSRALHCAEIARIVNVPYRTIGHALKRLREKGLIKHLPAMGRRVPWQAVSAE